jgi:hypothetical protein
MPCICGFEPVDTAAADAHRSTCLCTTTPTIPTGRDHLACSAAFTQALRTNQTDHVCAFCDVYIQLLHATAKVHHIEHNGDPPSDSLVEILSPPANLHPDLQAYYTTDCGDANSTWHDLLLSPDPRSVQAYDHDYSAELSAESGDDSGADDAAAFATPPRYCTLKACDTCHAALVRHDDGPSKPKFAISSGYFMGGSKLFRDQIPELCRLTEQEWSLIKPVISRNRWVQYDRAASNINANIIRQGGLAGHAVFTAGDPDAVEKYLQTLPAGHGGTVTFHVSGSWTKAEVARHIDPIIVRRDVVLRALQWLKVNNHLYQEIDIDRAAIDNLPEHDVLPGTLLLTKADDACDNDQDGSLHGDVDDLAMRSGIVTDSFDPRTAPERANEAAQRLFTTEDDIDDPDGEDDASSHRVGTGHYKTGEYCPLYKTHAWPLAFPEKYIFINSTAHCSPPASGCRFATNYTRASTLSTTQLEGEGERRVGSPHVGRM